MRGLEAVLPEELKQFQEEADGFGGPWVVGDGEGMPSSPVVPNTAG